jgi:hypothetical protein
VLRPRADDDAGPDPREVSGLDSERRADLEEYYGKQAGRVGADLRLCF